jgi:hypothetical protein
MAAAKWPNYLWRKKVTKSLTKTAHWSVLVLSMGLLGTASMPGKAAIYWPGGIGDPNNPKPSKDYRNGYEKGKKDCQKAPIDCGVMLEDTVANPGWGETEPNDHIHTADYLKTGIFYKGNSLDANDRDWYFVESDKPNQNLVISFMGDQADYTDTAGWIIGIYDSNGNLIASFISDRSGTGNVTRYADDEVVLAKIPMSQAKVLVHTLGNAGRYYISVASNEENGAERAYHIAAMISESDQITPNPDTNFHDAETEINDTKEMADPLRSNVHMFGTFGRKWHSFFIPAEDNVEYYYPGCDPSDIATIPPGKDNCVCNPDAVSPGTCASRSKGEGEWKYAYDYDNDWFYYKSDGNEQLTFEMCAKGQCDFARVHLRVIYIDDSTVIINTPIKPGQTFDFGVVSPGTYYIELSPEPTDGPDVDPETGVHTVDDLTGPYNFVLRSTGLPTNGGK